MEELYNKDFLSKLNKKFYKNNNDFKSNEEYIDISKELVKIKVKKQKLKKQNFDKTIKMIQNILLDINEEYVKIFNQMLNEEDENKPIIYVYNSNEDLNESLTFKNQIHFYKTNTEEDTYILLHEFTHFIINNKNRSLYKNKEVLPILMEFIISDILNDKTYIIDRLCDTIFNCKSLLIKNEIINNNLDLKSVIIKYNLSDEELIKINDDILYSKNLDYTDEITYIKGFLYAYYYSKEGIKNYNNLIDDFKVESIDLFELINNLRRGDYNEKRNYN